MKFVARTGVAAIFGLLITGATVGGHVEGKSAFPLKRIAHTPGISACPEGEHTRTPGSSSGGLTSHINQDSSSMMTCVADDNIATLQPAKRTLNASQAPRVLMRAKAVAMISARNAFPYGACTWYADQRYHDLHGTYVPWTNNANAWQWPQRANEYGWRVSSTPQVGAIIVLQSGVQGASWLGHVGIVEQVKGKNSVIASSMNWGANPWSVTRWQFHTGPGVTFISQ
jgi:N-acetylmuramoyl-L-alanine amidase